MNKFSKKIKIMFWVLSILLLCFVLITLVGVLNLEHSYFDFVPKKFKDIKVDEYTKSSNLSEYSIMGVVFKPTIRETTSGIYSLTMSGYFDTTTYGMEGKIKSINLRSMSGHVLIFEENINTPITFEVSESNVCYARNISSFAGEVETIKNYEELFLDITIEISVGNEACTKCLSYQITIVEYLTNFMVT